LEEAEAEKAREQEEAENKEKEDAEMEVESEKESDEEDESEEAASKKKKRLAQRLTVAQLKQLVTKPEVVEVCKGNKEGAARTYLMADFVLGYNNSGSISLQRIQSY
jgi:TATA-binding protein-associated factor Taf7